MMTTERLFLSLDQGGHSSRALVFDAQGNVICRAQCAVAVSTQGDQVEQSPVELVNSLVQVANDVVAQLPTTKRVLLQSAALVCQRSSVAFWRAQDGSPVAPVLSWQDRRGASLLADVIQTELSADVLKSISGLVANPHYGASKIAWMLRHDPDVKAALSDGSLHCGPLSAFLVRALSNNATDIVDAANACRTQLMNLATMDWDNEALAAFSVPRDLLPRIVPSFGEYGMLTLNDISLPLKYVNGDQNAALFANGMVDPHACYISMGTGAFCLSPLNSAEAPPHQLLTTLIALLQSPLYAIEGTVNAAASALDWLQDRLQRRYSHATIGAWLNDTELSVVFINAINGLASPFWRGDVESCFVSDGFGTIAGTSIGTDGAELTDAECFVAVIESVVFALCFNIQLMQNSGSSALRICVSGGLSQHDGICQRLADLSGLTVVRCEDAEASARGAAFWLAGCPVHWAAGLQREQFKPKQNAPLRKRYEQWQGVMQRYMG